IPGSDDVPFDLGSAKVSVKWADVHDPSSVSVSASGGPGQDLLNFVQTSTSQIVNGLTDLSGWFQQMAGVNLLGTKIPLVNKSLGDILGGQPKDLALDNAALTSLSAVFTDGAFNKFTAVFSDTDFRKEGVALGDTVIFTDAGGTDREGVVDAVDGGLITVRLD